MTRSKCHFFDCEECNHRVRGRCLGCMEGNQLRIANGEEPCAIYICALEKDVESCAYCTAVACHIATKLQKVCPVRADYEKKRCYVRKLSEHFKERGFGSKAPTSSLGVSIKTVDRLHVYLSALDGFIADGVVRVSSDDISLQVGIKDYLIRSDLNKFGGFGRPGVGYDVAFLRHRIAEILHLDEPKNMIWVGANRLIPDSMLGNQLADHGFNIVGVFDPYPATTRKVVSGLEVMPLSRISEIMKQFNANGAILAVTPDQAQLVADILIVAGIKGILNLTSSILVTPYTVCVRNVDILSELISLHYNCVQVHEQEMADDQIKCEISDSALDEP
ncbi:MAG: redox-sensing transcriptional repressor Rex [Armatimonadota bacterium]